MLPPVFSAYIVHVVIVGFTRILAFILYWQLNQLKPDWTEEYVESLFSSIGEVASTTWNPVCNYKYSATYFAPLPGVQGSSFFSTNLPMAYSLVKSHDGTIKMKVLLKYIPSIAGG